MQNTETKIFTFEEWAKGHRAETMAFLRALEGQSITEEAFLEAYERELGELPRTSRSKAKGVYRWLTRVGFIKRVTA